MTARHLDRNGPANPFPGLRALERRLGRRVPHQLGSNEGLDMPHRALREALGEGVAHLARAYGDAEAFDLRSRLQDRLGIPMEAMIIDAGADSLIALALRTLCDPGATVVTSAGTYPTFGYFAEGQGCQLVEVPYLGGPATEGHAPVLAPDPGALAEAARQHNAQLVYLANPDNPSGHWHDADTLDALEDALPDGCTLLLDEAYHDFLADACRDNRVRPRRVRLRTFSKAHGLAGLRIGYALASPALISDMHKVRIHYAVSSVALEAATVLLEHEEEVNEHIRDVTERRERLSDHLRRLGAQVVPSTTNFIAVVMADSDQAAEVHRALLTEGVIVHRPPHPALGHVLRISTVEDALEPGRLAALEAAL
ncbi:aminotransferase class I/II-fold pyridoxal phosphate-dependent enzyme [Kushneria phosphatilytica]|uniref:histidinol-phosphate transaminase n=1 Tax=Kushneria phosphatilytica TaxID=657387 RepID=A0A1S1NSN2_9GAMM|nr:aminotransferase class I/II-fold pyridoxal phosphate-dependent enzyme [Kushneria phosphatilytica]OHV08344.1 aminotransferase [Kushneria phosphatilytica]QEL09759.1 aminotransferase class I/II-fold pyridoxal phosphate-dependent enzyme [Kushneria phosphatilytica]